MCILNTVGILIIGNEILDGVILDTNSQWIIQQLKPLNYTVAKSITVRDDISEIAKAITRMKNDGIDLVITTGGLGPTYDDMTLKGVAEAFSIPMKLNEEAIKIVERQYKNFHDRGVIDSAEITDARRKMAVFPEGAEPLDNMAGGAPSELKWIFENQLEPILKKQAHGHYYEKIIYLNLRDESILAPLIDEAMHADSGVYIKSMVKPYGAPGIRLWVSAHGEDIKEIKERVEKIVDFLVELTKDQVYTD
jgi:nicotinamide-nucleotide amidase